MKQSHDQTAEPATGKQTSSLASTQSYHLRWRSYARRRRMALGALLAWLPVCFGLFAVLGYWLHLPALSLLLMAAWLGLAAGLVWWQGEFRCPRCNRRYGALGSRRGRTNWTRGIFDTVCANCKLRKFERVDGEAAPL